MPPTQIRAEKPWFESGCTLGEGPLYDARTSTLHFVDISEKKVFHLDTQTGHKHVEQFDVSVTCLALRKDRSGLACAAAEGFAVIENNSVLQYISQPLSPSVLLHTRFNDGGCDSKGRFFAGTICSKDPEIPGKLYRYDPKNNTCDVVDHGPFTDGNGLGWSPDEKIFYFTDSLTNKIYAYDYDDGNLSNRRLFVDAIALGMPENTYCDGLCIDSEGGVWSARWGGSRILRFTKDGAIDVEIIIPTALNITACCFGGENDDQLFVTTAHCGANGGDVAKQNEFPDSGHIFKIDLSGRYRGNRRHEFDG